MNTSTKIISLLIAALVMLSIYSFGQKSNFPDQLEKNLNILLEKEKSPLTTCEKEMLNLDGVIWHRDRGEREYYLTPVIKDKKEFYNRVSVYDSVTHRSMQSPLKKIRVQLTPFSKRILQDYCISVPDYIGTVVNILIPGKALLDLSMNNIPYQEIQPLPEQKTTSNVKDVPATTIWSEGFEGSLSPYSRNYYSGYSSCYWGDVNCFSHSGNWSLWCADDGSSAPTDCSNYINNMDAYVYNTDGIYVAGYTDVNFSFWIYYDTESNYDKTYYYYYNGSSWILDDTYTGYSGGWVQKSWLLTGFVTFQWDFEFVSDISYSSYYGCYIDDMEMTGNSSSPYLYVSTTDQTVPAPAYHFDVNVTSNVTWSASPNAGWLSCSPNAWTGDGILTVNYLENPTTTSRSADIFVTGSGITQTVHVTQLGTSNFLSVSPPTWSASENGDHFDINVTSNVTWSVSENCDWVTCTPFNGGPGGYTTVNYDQNTSTSTRVCNIIISGGGFSSTVVLTQTGMAPFLNITPSTANVNTAQGSVTVNISSNIQWSVSETCDWVNCTLSSGQGTIPLQVNYNANVTGSPRTCIISITGNGITQNFTLMQEGVASFLNVSPTSLTLECNAGSYGQVNISSNTHWVITKRPIWVQLSADSGDGNSTLTIAAASTNFLPNTRTGIMTMTTQAIIQDVQISQQACSAIEDLNLSNSISIYPNPTQYSMNIKRSSASGKSMNVEIYNTLGSQVIRLNDVRLTEAPYTINISQLPDGLYYMKIFDDEVYCWKKLIKQR